MDERFVKKLLVPSLIIIILSSFFLSELKYLVDFVFFKKKHLLIIGILSAPDNFEQRLSIRKTWLQLQSEISSSYYFIIGNEICGVPPVDRIDPYSCISKPYHLPKYITNETEFTTISIQNTKTTFIGYIGFSFYVRHKILVKKLGIIKELLQVFQSPVQVKLVSGFDSEVLASVTFSVDLLNETRSVILAKAIKPVVLMPAYEAYIKLEGNRTDIYPSCTFTLWDNDPNVINFIYLWHEDSVIPQPFTEKSCSYVFMSYNILDVDNLRFQIQNKNSRLKEWEKHNVKLSQSLKNESLVYNDLMFVNVVDVYKNLSRKMVHFFKRIEEKDYFHYVLKTDDDSFIDLIRVYNQLTIVNKEIDNEIIKSIGQIKETGEVARVRLSKFWWWSFFKEYWKVQRSGKWREDSYPSASYPTFPCGGGYIVNKGIVNFIVANEQSLNCFQGEDVSLGIWTSSLPVIHYRIPKVLQNYSYQLQKKIVTKFNGRRHWSQFKSNNSNTLAPNFCEWTCNNEKIYNVPLCNKVQLSVSDMYDVWSEYISNGFL